MPVVYHRDRPLSLSASGRLSVRKIVNAEVGATQQSVWRIEHEPGEVVARHWHEYEEVIVVLEGEGEATIGDETFPIGPDMSLIIPPYTWHGYRNTGTTYLKVLAILPHPDAVVRRDPLPTPLPV
ncbi:MAG TPA: cupin domain-containing protein [Chloroflexota bacterium]|jgi:mannose-6-phosphate isomerase-like protein (cupin superfamily)|nr:cupin domain-containing protein [Chloroflexota bacterium]